MPTDKIGTVLKKASGTLYLVVGESGTGFGGTRYWVRLSDGMMWLVRPGGVKVAGQVKLGEAQDE
jgi:hypothetical protein